MSLDDVYARKMSTVDAENPMHAGDGAEVHLTDVHAETSSSFDAENPMHADRDDAGVDSASPTVLTRLAHSLGRSLHRRRMLESRRRRRGQSAENPAHEDAGAPPAPDAAPRPSGGIELQEIERQKPWGERCLIKCDPSVSIKGTSRTGAKIADYEKQKGPGKYPYARPRRRLNIPSPRPPSRTTRTRSSASRA